MYKHTECEIKDITVRCSGNARDDDGDDGYKSLTHCTQQYQYLFTYVNVQTAQKSGALQMWTGLEFQPCLLKMAPHATTLET